MTTTICLCGCTQSDEARAARAARVRQANANRAGFELFYADLKAGRNPLTVDEYVTAAGGRGDDRR